MIEAPPVTEQPAAPTEASAGTVLCVDDEPNILAALKRSLRGAGYQVITADCGAQALEVLQNLPVDLVVSDMRMPGMDGAQLLEQVHQRWPQVVRVMLTGHADIGSTVAAINRGRIFRYLQKPWDAQDLLTTVHEGLTRLALEREKERLEALTRQQNDELRLLNTELELRVTARTAELKDANDRLKRNYLKSIKVFSNLLELRSGQLAGHGRRVADTARDIARGMGLGEEEVLHVFIAGLLHDIGLIGMADTLLGRPASHYSSEELAQYRTHPALAEASLLALDDMQPLLPIVRAHHERPDGHGFPDRLSGDAIPLGARILAIADAYDDLQHGHFADVALSPKEARIVMRKGRGTQFDAEAFDVFLHITEPQAPAPAQPGVVLPGGPADVASRASTTGASLVLGTGALESDMVLARDLVSTRGMLMLTAGHRLTPSLILKIREFEMREGGKFEIHIRPRGKT